MEMPTSTKTYSKKNILRYLYKNGADSRKNIASHLGLSRAALTMITAALIKDGIIYEVGKLKNVGVGRQEIVIDINYDKYYALGISCNQKDVSFVCTNLRGEIISELSFILDKKLDTKTLAYILEKIKCLVDNIKESILGVGVLAYGFVDNQIANNLGVGNIKEVVFDSLGHPVTLENNVRGLVKSIINYNKMCKDFWLIKYGPGLGSSIVFDNKIRNGHLNRSGEIGHIHIKNNGDLCDICKSYGCLESEISIYKMISTLQKQHLLRYQETDIEYFYRLSLLDEHKLIRYNFSLLINEIEKGYRLLDPGEIVLTGDIFTKKSFIDIFLELLNKSNIICEKNIITLDDYVHKMKIAPSLMIINDYFGCD